MRPLPIAILLLVAAVPAAPAGARDPFGPPGRPGPRIDRAALASDPGGGLRAQERRMRRHTAVRRAEAAVRLQHLHRDAQHRAAAAELHRRGTPSRVRSHRARVEAVERADDLRLRRRLAELDPVWWSRLGPETRRVLEASGIELRRAERRRELRRELDALEREVAGRDGSAVWTPPGGDARP